MERPARILVVDDETAARTALAELLRDEGYAVDAAGDGFKALARAEGARPDLVLTDLRMPSLGGIGLIRRLRRADITAPVVVMTAFGGVDAAVESMREGAFDFVVKPLDTQRLLAIIEQALTTHQSPEPVLPRADAEISELATDSHEMREAVRRLTRAAPTRANVLLHAEPGTGRARLARALHERSRVAEGPFVTLRCAELDRWVPEARREAVRDSVRRAAGGTLYLSDVGDLSIDSQSALLDALPVSGSAADVRVVSSSADTPRELGQSGRFRDDLALVLSVVEIRVPTLRDRPDDLIALCRSILGADCPGLSAEAVGRLRRHDWPGNLPELRRVLYEAWHRSRGGVIRAEHVVLPEKAEGARPAVPGSRLADIERYAILKTLAAQNGSTTRAARVLGISVRKIQYKLHEYGARQPAPRRQRSAEG
jgi:two-component system response regulator HydG